MCWAYDDPAEFFSTVAVYVSGGLRSGQRVACYLSAARQDAAIEQLRGTVPGFDGAVETGALILGSFEDSYVSDEGFDADARLDGYASMVDGAINDGFTALRVLGDAHPALEKTAGTDVWAAYELRADLLAARKPLTALCTYDLHECGPDALRLVRSLHGTPETNDEDSVLGFRLRAAARGGVAVAGEVDSFSAAVVGGVLVKAVVDVPDAVIDVAALEFVDAAGMRALARALKAVPGSPRIRGASASFRKLWAILGCDQAAPVEFVE